MHRFWNAFTQPLLQAAKPRLIVEIGSDRGENTRRLLAWCAQSNAVLHVIDPLPKYDPEAWRAEYGERLVFHRGLSLESLPEIGAADLVLIDGDHNWYTVFNELRLIERRMKALNAPMPCILLHDVGWPYGRRDLYYDPATIPEKHRKPYARKGLVPGQVELADKGGMNAHLDHALLENEAASGVLTAVEDYIKKTHQAFRWIRLEGIHGLGALLPESRIAENPALAAFAAQWTLPEAVTEFQRAIEQDRIRIESERQTERHTVLEQARQIRNLEGQGRAWRERLEALERDGSEMTETLRDLQAQRDRFETALREKTEKVPALDQTLKETRAREISAGHELAQVKAALDETRAQAERLRQAAERDRQARHELEKTEIALRERNRALEESLGESRETAKALQAEAKDAHERINEGVREKARLDMALRDLEHALEDGNKARIQSEKRVGQLEIEREASRLKIEDLSGRIAEASRQQEIARRQLQEKSQEAARLAHRLEETTHEAERTAVGLRGEIAAALGRIEALEKDRNDRQAQIDRLRFEKKDLEGTRDGLRRELAAQADALAGETDRRIALEGRIEALDRALEQTGRTLHEVINDRERWEHALRAQREEATAERARHGLELKAAGERLAAEEQKNQSLAEELRAVRGQRDELEKIRREQETTELARRLDFRRFYLGRQRALNQKAHVAVDFLSRYGLLRRVGSLGLSLAKSLAPGLSEALAVARSERQRLGRQKARDRRKGYEQRIEQYLGIGAKKKSGQKKPKISVVAWDVGHNPLGRAYLLADMFCNRSYDAELIGPQFPRYGNEVWPPLKNMRIPLQSFPGRLFPAHWADLERMAEAIDGDVIYVSKPRLPSLLLGILAKMQRNRPLVLDIDDYELAFFKHRAPLSLEELVAAPRDKDFLCPHENLWTRYAETLAAHADAITVSNAQLQKKFGGLILPHVRNSEHFNPALYDREAIRASLGFAPEDRVILFIGTPRLHKGFLEIIEALERLGNPRYKLCIIGTVVDREVRRRLDALPSGRVHSFPDAPFEDLPRNLSAGDLICILQDPTRLVSAFQMPAKVTDALSMGIPMLGSDVAPLKDLAAKGLVELLGGRPLDVAIDDIFCNYEKYKARAEENRKVFGRDYAYVVNRENLWSLFSGLIAHTPPVPGEFQRCVDFMRAEFSGATAGAVAAVDKPAETAAPARAVATPKPVPVLAPSPAAPPEPIRRLVPSRPVFFWKQNDSDLYGRRQDMMVKYLAAHPRINRIIHFDAPIEYGAWMRLMNWSRDRKYDQRGLIFKQTLKRLLGLGNRGKVIRKTYVYMGRKDTPNFLSRRLFGAEEGYVDFVRKTLDRQRVWDRRTVFWVCPANFHFPRVLEAFAPDLVVADVIDDQRKWPCREQHRQRLHENYGRILAASDLVIANCDNVARSMEEFHRQVHIVPNACEYFNGRLASFGRPWRYRKMRGPIIGYVGNLDASRLDIELLDYVARKRPEWQLVLIGSLHMNQDILELRKHANVHFLGVIPYGKVLGHIRHFDVAIIPHIDNGMTQVMNPLKTYVYCALDVPVVSTAISNLSAMESLVHVAHTPSAFLKKIELCLKNGKTGERPGDIDALLRDNSWQTRVDEVMTHVFDHPLMTGE